MSTVITFPSSPTCEHVTYGWRNVVLSICPDDESSEWTEDGETIDGAEAMAILFGSFDLTGCLASISAPSQTVFVYRPGRTAKSRLEAFPVNTWLPGAAGLFFSHDGTNLLLAPTDPQLVANLSR